MTGVSGGSLGGVYTSPYFGTVDGGVVIPIICDDYVDDSYFNETWTAYDTNLGTGPLGTSLGPTAGDDGILKWGATGNPDPNTANNTDDGNPGALGIGVNLTQTEAYDIAANMITQLLTPSSPYYNSPDLSFAIWGLFDADALTADPTATGILQTFVSDFTAPVSQSAAYSNVNIYTYVPGSGVSDCGGCAPPPQEFIVVSMAEAPSPAILGAYLLGFGCLAFFFRRRLVRSVN
jgi:hypothetical protein